MGDLLGIKASQVRKDLSYFGEIGKRGVGYHVDRLYEHIRDILSSPRLWKIALAGVGHLGEALLGHSAFRSEKFRLEAAFDSDEGKIGRIFHGTPCFSIEEMPRMLQERGIEVLILAVPAGAAQAVADRAISSGTVRGILNFAPTPVAVPPGVLVVGVDISIELEKLLFFLKEREG